MSKIDRTKQEQDRHDEVCYLVHQAGFTLMEALSLTDEVRAWYVKKAIESMVK